MPPFPRNIKLSSPPDANTSATILTVEAKDRSTPTCN